MTTPSVSRASTPARLHSTRWARVGVALLLVTGAAMALPARLDARDTRDARARRERERERDGERERGRERRASAPLDTTVAVDPRALVELSLGGGTLVVRTWDRGEVRLRVESEGHRIGLEASRTRVSIDDGYMGDERRIEVTMPRQGRLDIEGNDLEIDVGGVRGGIALENMSGDVRLADVGGLVRAEVMAGELSVRGGDGDFRLELASGDVELDDVAGRIEVENVSGDITVRRGRARELRLETTSGTVTYEGTVQADGSYELSTHSGDVALRLPAGTRARLEADTYNGEFTSDFPVTMQPGTARGAGTRQRRYELLVGDGGGPLIRISSFTGDITLARSSGARPDSTR